MQRSTSHEFLFVLTLGEALSRLSESPTEEQLQLMASLPLVPLEYETLNRILCPHCAGHRWNRVTQEALHGGDTPGKLDWPYFSPPGDRLTCSCADCGHTIRATFWFTR